MTERELAEIEERAAVRVQSGHCSFGSTPCQFVGQDIPALVAEVRRQAETLELCRWADEASDMYADTLLNCGFRITWDGLHECVAIVKQAEKQKREALGE